MTRLTRALSAAAVSLAVLLLAAACQTDRDRPAESPTPLLLISIDGFRHDYIERFDSPTIDRLIREGLHADSMHHAFPTKTFATHYTMVTGRYPGTHGVVANNMWDPRREASFSLGDREAVNDGFWYQGGEPIWVTAEQQGLTAATYFWPGSEAVIQRTRPTHFKPYDGRVPHEERIDQVLDWLAMPSERRPDFLTLYFSRVDSRGHGAGPAAPETLAAAEEVDARLGDLLAGLEAMGMLDRINILLVSDHGMDAVSRERTIALDEYLDLSKLRVSDWGPAAQIWEGEMSAGEIVAALEGAPHLRAWTRENIPDRYRFGSHYRVPDVLVEADPGWLISSKPYMANPDPPRGMHGWDPALAVMHGFFIARGPAFAAGSRSPAVRSVDLYPLMSELLGLEPAENEGRLAVFEPYLEARRALDYRVERFDCEAGPVEARIAPEHMALHVGEFIHVLDRRGEGRFASIDLSFVIDGDRARGVVDGRSLGECRRLP
ncbi:MAG: sulfatase-like hydrolase/transferase [Gammaproteobacteria bacterium]|jgi:predicted AlkP superfamily pyrophosphatase or phosphodiesterase|nr:sulfatase-like hydrolase/transferase [Gammaproteobacteria bacterium]